MKKGFMLVAVAGFMFLCAGTMNVKADEYDITSIMQSGPQTITAEDTVKYNDTIIVGEEGLVDLSSGEATITYDSTTGFNIAFDGTATISGSKVVLSFSEQSINLTISNESTLNISGNVAIPSKSTSMLTNNGTINVTGSLELRNKASLVNNGTINVNGGTFANFSNNNLTGNGSIVLTGSGKVYSQAALSQVTPTSGYELVIANKVSDFTSAVTPDLSGTEFSILYTVAQSATDNNATEEGTTTDTTAEDTTSDEVTNPQTADSILLITLALLVSGCAAAFVGRKLVKERM